MNEKLKELNNIMNEYPDLEVKFMVSNDDICDDFTFTSYKITSIMIEYWIPYDFKYDFRIYTDYGDLIEYLVDILQDYETYEEARQAFPLENYKQCIVVYLGA